MSRKNEFSREDIRKKRKFPAGYVALLILCIAAQSFLCLLAIFYDPQPQDVITNYCITVEPLEDGTLDITYDIEWHALDADEPLSWIEIGIPNDKFSFYKDETSSNISRLARDYNDEGGVWAVLYLDREYRGGEVLDLHFKINQKQMLCKDGDVYFYEFVPGWFNSTPVEYYEFKWTLSPDVKSHNGMTEKGGYAVWSGEMPCGTYELMRVKYSEGSFDGSKSVKYEKFDDSGVYDQLQNDKGGVVALCVVLMIIIAFGELVIIDGFVSYGRGRGFMRGYGYHVHIYGHVNPHYSRARAEHNARSGGSRGGGGGCACACACACAGGGRAGCSQKDTYSTRFKKKK